MAHPTLEPRVPSDERLPELPEAWFQRGVEHLWAKREAQAETCLRRALELFPGYSSARFKLAYLLLRQGRYPEGWAALESRPPNLAFKQLLPAPRWEGEDLAGKSLLVGQEGGHGDMIMFSRYLPLLRDLGAARLGLICLPGLKRLFSTLEGVDTVIAMGEPIPGPGWDHWILPASLPLRFGTTADTIPAPIPYLRPDAARSEAWAGRLPPRPRVGLVWKGNPDFMNDLDRSLPHLHALAPLAAVPGVRFVSLQKGPGQDEAAAPPAGMDLFDAAPDLHDFADTAALVAQLDLVIAIDTAVAHLAGALGRPCWVLLPHYRTDWRWFETGEASPWYPGSMRLFRQGPDRDWAPVLARVAAELGWAL